jgi:hypothetical protein
MAGSPSIYRSAGAAGTPRLFQSERTSSTGKTMDDVVSMDAVTDMDTLDEGASARTMNAVVSMDAVINMNTLQETS